ncbi:MAG: class I SAM-dependent methyltransferase [Alphaproteobacteria bacterium]
MANRSIMGGMSLRWRARWQGLATVLGAARLGFFIPYAHAGHVRPLPYPSLEPIFDDAEPAMRDLFDQIEAAAPILAKFTGPPPAPRLNQDWFPRLDAAAAYCLVALEKPRRIVEIGSGHSTRVLARAVKDAGLETTITCIDPAPRAAISKLGVTHIPTVLAKAPGEVFANLEAHDMLFVDSSHIAMPGTDVDQLFGEILPRLKLGTLVHIHDVFLPDAYPAAWERRGYNEQLPVACLLQGGYGLRWSSHFVATRRPWWLEAGPVAKLPLIAGAHETSVWLQRS